MVGPTTFDERHGSQVCLFPTLNSRPGKEHIQLQHVGINLPPGPLIQSFLTNHRISIASFFGTGWGIILQSYTDVERPIFGFVHDAIQNPGGHNNLDEVISIGSLQVDDTVSVVEMMRHLNFRSEHSEPSEHSAPNRDNFRTLQRDVFNSILVHREGKNPSLDFNFRFHRGVSENIPLS